MKGMCTAVSATARSGSLATHLQKWHPEVASREGSGVKILKMRSSPWSLPLFDLSLKTVYTELARISNECSHSKNEEEQVLIAKKPKVDSLLDYHEPSSDLSPTDVCDQVEREVSHYKSEEKIDNTPDPLYAGN